MQADVQKVLKDTFEHSIQFSIPVYQRNYSWTTVECKKMLDDIKLNSRAITHNHLFLGTLVLVEEDNIDFSTIHYTVIDGQQRLTTISLLIKTLLDSINTKCYEIFKTKKQENFSNKISSIINQLKKFIYNENIISEKNKDPITLKMKLNDSDNEIYSKIMNPEFEISNINPEFKKSYLFLNYTYFYSAFNEIFSKCENKEKFEEICLKIIEKLFEIKIVSIAIKKSDKANDNPQLIFESINSTGVSLTPSDLIRNLILLEETAERQKELYNKYWKKIEANLSAKEVTSAISCYLVIYKGKNSIEKNIYRDFKNFFLEGNDNNIIKKEEKEELLNNLVLTSNNYKKIISDENSKIQSLINISSLEMTQFYPLIIVLLEYLKKNKISRVEFEKILNFLVIYYIRRALYNSPTGSLSLLLNSIAFKLNNELKSGKSTREGLNLSNQVIGWVLGTKGKAFLPTNNQLINSDVWRTFYKNSNKKFIFEAIEMTFSPDPYNRGNSKYTIEHIMPKSLTEDWKKELGSDFELTYTTFLDSIGNLTLVSNNSQISNKSFSNKKNEYSKSRLKINSNFNTITSWNREAIEYREKQMIEKVLSVFPYPNIPNNFISDISSKEKITIGIDELNINSEFYDELTEMIPIKFVFENYKQRTVNSWKELYSGIIEQLFEINLEGLKAVISDVVEYFEEEIPSFIRKDEVDENLVSSVQYKNINHTMWLFLEFSDPQEIILRIDVLLEKLKIDKSTLKIVFKNK